MRNLLTPRWMLIKTALFLVLAAMAGGLLVAQEPTWTTVVCVVVVAWRAAAPTASRSGRRPRCVALGWHDPGGRQRDASGTAECDRRYQVLRFLGVRPGVPTDRGQQSPLRLIAVHATKGLR